MNVEVDLQALKAVIFDRLAVDAPSVPLRAMLPSGALGIVDAVTLAIARPATPFIALRRGPFNTIEDSIGNATFYMFIYDDRDNTYLDTNEMLRLLVRSFNYEINPLNFNGSQLGKVDIFIGEETVDPALDLLSTKVTLTVYC